MCERGDESARAREKLGRPGAMQTARDAGVSVYEVGEVISFDRFIDSNALGLSDPTARNAAVLLHTIIGAEQKPRLGCRPCFASRRFVNARRDRCCRFPGTAQMQQRRREWCNSCRPAATRASTPVAVLPRERQPGALARGGRIAPTASRSATPVRAASGTARLMPSQRPTADDPAGPAAGDERSRRMTRRRVR